MPQRASGSVVAGQRRLRIAYLSADLYQHPMGRFIQDLFAAHDRRRFEVTCVVLASHSDATQQRIKANCEHWIDISNVTSFDANAALLQARQFDVAIDLNGWTKGL